MNAQEIYKQRIADSSSDYANSLALPEGDNRVIHSIDFCNGATFALQNQWISVEEALQPKEDNGSSITVLVHCQKGWCGIDYYRYKYGEWLNNGNSVTHWMPIPSLKGGEK